MNGSAAVDIRKKPTNEVEVSMLGSNPFREIEKQNYEKRVLAALRKKWVHSTVVESFDAWDAIVCIRLKQLCNAVMPELHQKPQLNILRAFSRNNLVWFLLGRVVKYRIVCNRRSGVWMVELFKRNSYSNYGLNDLVQVRFVLNERSVPVGFHLCRGSDNKTFNTDLSEDDLTRSLICHFSRFSCGSNLDDDLKHLQFLRDSKVISVGDYTIERLCLLSNKDEAKLYVLPTKPAHVAIKREARVRLLFSIFCILLLVAIVIYAKKYSGGYTPPSAISADLLKH